MASKLIYSWTGKQLIACVRTGQRGDQSYSNIHDRFLAKIVSNVNLKTSTILAKRLILNAWLSPECAPADRYITVLKIQAKLGKDGIILINHFQLKFKP